MSKGHRGKRRDRGAENISERNRVAHIGYHCLAFVDILNQKEALRKIHKLPDTETEKAEFINQWKEAFGVVDAYRSSFDSFFKAYSQPTQPKLPKLNREETRLMRHFLNYEIKEQLFSDTMIYYVSLMDHPNRLAITGVYSLLMACAGTFLATLSGGLVCRGGIEAGIAAEFFKGEIYGPALYHAHRLESEVAKYPRIAIGAELSEYIETEMRNPEQSLTDQYRRSIAQKCKTWITTDVDNALILDYAGLAARHTFPESIELVDSALSFVQKEWDRFQEEGNIKLTQRYSMLHSYLSSRKNEVWK
jgi:hypothetical protein